MKNKVFVSTVWFFVGFFCLVGFGQTPPAAQGTQEPTPELSLLAVTYPEGENVKVMLAGTARLMGATGKAEVRRKLGITEIQINLDGMKPAISIGGDFNTYVLWAISPEGITFNVGELVLQGAKSELRTTTPLETFGMFVTAEPHFLVEHPSGFFVLLNVDQGLKQEKGVTAIPFKYDTIRTGYSYKRPNLMAVEETKGTLRTDRFQAIIAVDLADQVNARKYAPVEFAQAQTALSEVQKGFGQGMEEKQLLLLSHRAIRLAVEARRIAQRRAAEENLAAERAENKQKIEQLTQRLQPSACPA